MNRLVSLSCIAALLTASVHSQSLHPVGVRDVAIRNVTTSGSSVLQSRVYYPATQPGVNAPVLPKAGGWPVFVFLHGFGGLGQIYGDLADVLAARGIVAVMSDTAWIDNELQRRDGLALYPSLVAENQRTGGVLEGALDMKRAALGGHSMGGGNTVRVLATNPGYVAGICFAPVINRETPKVKVPLLILHGEGDSTLNWRTHGLAHYGAASAFTALKVFYLLNGDCNHRNVVLLLFPTQTDREVFARCASVAHGWLHRFLEAEPAGLENVVGPAARAERRLTRLDAEYEAPEHWQDGSGRIGTTHGMRIAAEPGAAALFFATKRASVATVWGMLLLDPATLIHLPVPPVGTSRLLDVRLQIPNDASLAGVVAPFQALGLATGARVRWTGASELRIVR